MAVDIGEGILSQSDVRETITNTEEASARWNLVYANYEGRYSLANARDLFISPNGLELYICNDDDDVVQYTMTSRWDVTTASLTHTLDVNAYEDVLRGLFFKQDGTKMYIVGQHVPANVREFDLSTAWDISTAVYLQMFQVSGEVSTNSGFYMREDGKMMYITDSSSGKAQAYSMSTAWDLSTAAVFNNHAYAAANGIFFSKKGDKFFVCNNVDHDVDVWNLDTLFRVSTGSSSYDWKVVPVTTDTRSIFFNVNGSKMFILTHNYIFQYNLKRSWR